jgi:hypothetical protein
MCGMGDAINSRGSGAAALPGSEALNKLGAVTLPGTELPIQGAVLVLPISVLGTVVLEPLSRGTDGTA